MSARSRSSVARSSRETYICDRPTRSAISVWVSPSVNRRCRIVRSRSGRRWSALETSRRSTTVSRKVVGRRQRSVDGGGLRVARRRVRRLERQRIVRHPRGERLEDLLAAHARPRRRAAARSGACPGERRAAARALDDQHPLLERARNVDGPACIAQVALELAEDRRDRVGRERAAPARVEAVDRLHERQAGHLLEVFQRLRRVAVAAREAARERQMALDQRGAGRRVAGPVPPREERVDRSSGERRPSGARLRRRGSRRRRGRSGLLRISSRRLGMNTLKAADHRRRWAGHRDAAADPGMAAARVGRGCHNPNSRRRTEDEPISRDCIEGRS